MKITGFCRIFLAFTFIMGLLVFNSCSDSEPVFPDEDNGQVDNGGDSGEEPEIPADPGDPGDEDLNTNTQDVDYDDMVSIVFSDGTAAVTNPFDGNGVTVTAEGEHLVITSTITDTEIYYVLSGITADGSVKFYGNYKFNLVFNGVGITNPRGAAVNIQCSKKISVILEDGTTNRLIDGETYEYTTGEDMKGTFFSEGQLVFDGNGTMEVRGKNKHGICSDDYIRVNSGNIWVKEAASDAIHCNDYIELNGGTVTTRSAGEGLECEKGYIEVNGGELNVVTTGQKADGIKSSGDTAVSVGEINITVYGNASKCFNVKGNLNVSAGTLRLNTAGDAIWDTDDNDTSSCAGIKCSGDTEITGGDVTIVSTGSGGKGINVDGTLLISGNNVINVTTTGDQFVYDRNNDTAAKAIKSTGNLTIEGGSITVRTSKTEAEGIESKATLTIRGGDLDIRAYDDCLNASDHIQIDGGTIYCYSMSNDGIDSNGTLTITGGTVISVGAGSPEAGIDCDNSRFTITGGTILGLGGSTSIPTENACTQRSVIYSTSSTLNNLHIRSASGEDILTYDTARTFSRTVVLFSSPDIAANSTYYIYTGGTIAGGSNLFGLYTGSSYSGGSASESFTANNMVSNVNYSSGGGGGGNNPGGGGARP